MKRSDKAFCIIQAFTSMLGRDINNKAVQDIIEAKIERFLLKASGNNYRVLLNIDFPHTSISIKKHEGKESYFYCNLLDYTKTLTNERTTE